MTRYRIRKEAREPSRYKDFVSLAALSYQDLSFKEPKSYEDAICSKQSKESQAAMNDKMNSLIKFQT